MKRLLATTAIATMAMTGAASAQSLLERVLADVGGGLQDVTGVFANTADNVLPEGIVPNTTTIGGETSFRNNDTGEIISLADYTVALADAPLVGTVDDDGDNFQVTIDGVTTTFTGATAEADRDAFRLEQSRAAFAAEFQEINTGGDVFTSTGINASVTNILRGLDSPTATTAATSATEAVNAVLGNIDTTALGAVNTGDIALIGTNQNFVEDIDQAIAGTSDALQQRIAHEIQQVGSITGQTMLAINSALNETNVDASVLNSMTGVNVDIAAISPDMLDITATTDMTLAGLGDLMGTISTTALGAVNTGTIVSGANDTVDGVVSSIVGNAATSTAFDSSNGS